MIKNIFFDFNGTILDDLDLCLAIEDEMMLSHNIRPYSMEEYKDKFYFPVKKYYHDVGFKDDKFVELANYFNNQYALRWKKETRLFNDCKNTIIKLKNEGYKIYCLSASEINFLCEQLKYFEIYDLFDGICGAQNGFAAGKIEYGRKFISDNNINVNETIMIGDTIHDYEVSKEFGFETIIVSFGHNSKKRLLTLNVPVCDSFNEVENLIQRINK